MPTEETTTTTDGDQASTSGEPQAGAPTTGGQAPMSQPTSTEPPAQERLEHERIIAELRKENAAARKRLEAIDQANKEAELAKLSEHEKLQKQLADHQSQSSMLAKQLQEERLDKEVIKQASKLNIIDVDAASKLIDASSIVYDESGRPTNVDALLKELAKARPWLTGKPQAQTSGGATNPSRSQTQGPQEITKEYVQEVQRGGQTAWKALSDQDRQRITTFVNKGGMLKR